MNFDPYKDTIRVIAMAPIGGNKQITITKLVDILQIKDGDELLYLLDENAHFSVRKINKGLNNKETYISVNKVRKTRHGMVTMIPRDIMDALELKAGDNLVFILDNNDILIQGPILSNECIINGLMMELTVLSPNQITTIPEIVRDIILVETGDIVVFFKKNRDIYIKSIDEFDNNLTVIGMSKLGIRLQIYLKKELLDMIDSKDTQILWILDNNGDIIIRNTVLPKTCI